MPLSLTIRPERSSWAITILATIAALIVAGVLVARTTRAPAAPVQWADFPPEVETHAWKWIVIHHSGTRTGDTVHIDEHHEKKNGWEGIGYHFVIGNGAPMPIGRIEATFRWRLQRHGAHAGPTPAQAPYNQDGIGICLIGNYQEETLKPFVEDRLVELCTVLIRNVPTLTVKNIISHRDLKDTECPGKNVDIERIKRRVEIAIKRAEQTEAAKKP